MTPNEMRLCGNVYEEGNPLNLAWNITAELCERLDRIADALDRVPDWKDS